MKQKPGRNRINYWGKSDQRNIMAPIDEARFLAILNWEKNSGFHLKVFLKSRLNVCKIYKHIGGNDYVKCNCGKGGKK
jgi:hypothetical protein